LDDLSTEVKAKETHENAVGYFKVSEQYGYKFIMEVKKIRDERYYKELGFSSFDDYCNDAWGFNRQWVDKKIRTASELNESDFVSYTIQFGNYKAFLLATMEDEQREKAINEGVPTKQGNKSIDEATQKEINEWKRQAKESEQAKQQAERQAEQARNSEQIMQRKLEESENKEPEVVEKEILKEVVPEYVKEQLQEKESTLQSNKEEMESMKQELHKLRNRNTGQNDQEEKEKEVKMMMLDASKSVLSTKIKIDEFLQEVAVTPYRRGAIATSSDGTKRKLQEGIEDLRNFINEMELALNGTIEHSKQGDGFHE